jgi:hypothetical protein
MNSGKKSRRSRAVNRRGSPVVGLETSWKRRLKLGENRSGKSQCEDAVTPEVAGSSPVAPVKLLQVSMFAFF